MLEKSVAYYQDAQVPTATWRGRTVYQFRFDLWKYAELLWRYKPPFVIEIGTNEGGCAAFLADVMAAFRPDAKVITIDVSLPTAPPLPDLPNLIGIGGSSTDEATLIKVHELVGDQRGFVLIDGDHSAKQVMADLEAYADMADYMVVQDTIMQWLGGYENDNPMVALGKWYPAHLSEFMHDDFQTDVTQHPGGWLKRRGA